MTVYRMNKFLTSPIQTIQVYTTKRKTMLINLMWSPIRQPMVTIYGSERTILSNISRYLILL